MEAALRVSVVIPVYNEDENIAQTMRTLTEFLPAQHEIICVYDSDEDTTIPVLERIGPQYPQLEWIKNTVARGPSGALRTGFEAAKGEVVVVVMADMCDDHSQLAHLLALMPEQADIVCPSRYCKGGRQELSGSLKVWLPSTAGFLLRRLAGIPTYDPTNSFKLYSAEVLNSLELRSTVSFSVTLEIVVKAHRLGYRIVEVPTVWRDRQHGETSFRILPSIPAYLRWFFLALFRRPVGRSLRARNRSRVEATQREEKEASAGK